MNAQELQALKAGQKATWESGDFGQVARYNMPSALEFMARLGLRPELKVLDVACGSGNLAVIAARKGCPTSGVDIAANLIQQARQRAAAEGLSIHFQEGDAEALPFPDGVFDLVVSMYGAMFAPCPEVVAAELLRVTKPGGLVGMANWTPQGFVGRMFNVFQNHFPPPPATLPSPMLWGDEATVTDRLRAFASVRLTRRIAVLSYPFPPAETIDFFRRFYGPTGRAFDQLEPQAQKRLRDDLVALQTEGNASADPAVTEVHAEYLEVLATK